MISANNVYNLLTSCQQMFGEKYGGPPLAQYYLPTRYQQIFMGMTIYSLFFFNTFMDVM
jgi:hypothetical protein